MYIDKKELKKAITRASIEGWLINGLMAMPYILFGLGIILLLIPLSKL
jgi:hypothetical protein